jgi:hypothetical protein
VPLLLHLSACLPADAAAFYLRKAAVERLSSLVGTKPQGSGSNYVPDFTRCIDHFALHAGRLM